MPTPVSANFTRPADTTAYTAGDLVANSTTAGSVVALSWVVGGGVNLRSIRLRTDNATITNGTFNLWLFDTNPITIGVTNGDNGALAGVALSTVIAVCPIDLDGSMGGQGGVGLAFYDPGLIQIGGTVYGLLEARGAYVPASGQVITIVLGVER